jgi:YfiH family protein
VGDDAEAVSRNRARLVSWLGLPAEPLWLNQVHGCGVASVERDREGVTADAAVAVEPGRVCAVLTADCLPLLLCDRAGSRVAAVHAGWRGLLAGVVDKALDALERPCDQILAWMGPAIGPDTFEVGDEVRTAFIAANHEAEAAFRPSPSGRWLADIYALARNRLMARGVPWVGGGDRCTVGEPEQFYSYRRDGITGRMASLIWLTS